MFNETFKLIKVWIICDPESCEFSKNKKNSEFYYLHYLRRDHKDKYSWDTQNYTTLISY